MVGCRQHSKSTVAKNAGKERYKGKYKMGYRYHNYTDTAELEDIGMTLDNFIRYALMPFRPAGTILICVLLTIVVAIPCVGILITSESTSTRYAISMAIVTGVIASGLVSLALEMCNNYRHNRKRFVVLNYYLYVTSSYEESVEWASHGKYEKYDKETYHYLKCQETGEISNRLRAVAELVLFVAPPVDEALEKGSEYLSIKEMQYATRAKEAAEDIAEIAKNEIFEHMKNHSYSFFDCLEENYRNRIMRFSDDEEIRITDENLESVICDYLLSNLDEQSREVKLELVGKLSDFDYAMHELQKMMRFEPVMYENLSPMEERLRKLDEKLSK